MFGNLISFNLQVTFHINISALIKIKLKKNKKPKVVSLLQVIRENKVYVIYCFIKYWKPHFVISEMVFQRFLLNYTEFVHETSCT